MSPQPPRDVRADAGRVIARALADTYGTHLAPDAVAADILTRLTGHHIGLTDTTRPDDPVAGDWIEQREGLQPTDDYRAAREALKGQQQ